jgi:hypothetical protein
MEKQVIQANNLSVNLDLPQCYLPDNVFTRAINFVSFNNMLVATKKSVFAPKGSSKGPWDSIPNPVINILAGQIRNQYYFLLSGVSHDYFFDGSSFIDMTSTDRVAAGALSSQDKNLWTTCKSGFITCVNNSEFFPEYWTGQFGELLKGLPFSPTKTFKQKNIRCKSLRSHKNFLLALNLTEKGVEYPYSYRWSHPADTNGLPFSWDELDLSTLASKESIGGDYGVIVDGLSLRDSFCIYTERAIHVLDYIGDEFVFKRRLLTSSYGCISQNCVVEAENLHYIITTSDIIVNDGTTVQSLLTGTLKSLFNNVSQRNYKNSYAVVNVAKTEIWFCFPEGGYVFPSMAIVYNYVTKQFGITRLASQRFGIGEMSSICFGPVLGPVYPWYELDTYFDIWDNWNLPIELGQTFQGIGFDLEPSFPIVTGTTDIWDNFSISLLKTDLFCVGPNMSHIEQLNGARDYLIESLGSRMPIVTIFEKTNWALGGQIDVKTLTRIYPHLTVIDNGLPAEALLFIGAHDFNNSTVRWNDAIIFNPMTDRKIDVRVTGELLAIRFEFRGYEEVVFYGFNAEYTKNGVR